MLIRASEKADMLFSRLNSLLHELERLNVALAKICCPKPRPAPPPPFNQPLAKGSGTDAALPPQIWPANGINSAMDTQPNVKDA